MYPALLALEYVRKERMEGDPVAHPISPETLLSLTVLGATCVQLGPFLFGFSQSGRDRGWGYPEAFSHISLLIGVGCQLRLQLEW